MTTANAAAMEPAGSGLIEFLGPIPCPTEGCMGEGQLVRFPGPLEVRNVCAACAIESEKQQQEEERAERAAKLRSNAGETPRLAGFTLDTYPRDDGGEAALAAALRWRDGILSGGPSARRNLFLFGERGSGKTGLLWPIAASLCDNLVETKLVDFPTLLEEMKDSYSKRVPFDRTDLARVKVLILDDLGAERPTEWARGQLLHLVNQRYERLLFTAFASNYTPGDLAARLGHDDRVAGDRILSRIVESCIQHQMKSRDRRIAPK